MDLIFILITPFVLALIITVLQYIFKLIKLAIPEKRCSVNHDELVLLIEKLSHDICQLAEENTQLKSRLSKLEKRMDEAQSGIVGETKEILIAKTKYLEKQLKEKTLLAENLLHKTNETETTIHLLNNEITTNKEELDKVTALNATKQNMLMLQNELDKNYYIKKLNDSEQQNKELEKKLDEAKITLEELNHKNRRQTENETELENRVVELEKKMKKMIKRNNSQLFKANTQLESIIEDLSEHIIENMSESIDSDTAYREQKQYISYFAPI